jgi:hypothetical protein
MEEASDRPGGSGYLQAAEPRPLPPPPIQSHRAATEDNPVVAPARRAARARASAMRPSTYGAALPTPARARPVAVSTLGFLYMCYRSGGQVFSVDTVYPVSIQFSNDKETQ